MAHDEYGYSDPGFIHYTPSEPPAPEEAFIALETGEIPLEVYEELRRRYRELPKRSPERRRGIVEAEGPQGRRYRYDRYGELVGRGFQPRRDKGRAFNVLKYVLDAQSGALPANVAARERAAGRKARHQQMTRADWREQEARRAAAANAYNQWIAQEQERQRELERDIATQQYRRQMLARPQWSPSQERYWGAQADLLEDYQRRGLDRSGDPIDSTGRFRDVDTDELMERLDEVDSKLLHLGPARSKIEGMSKPRLWGLMGGDVDVYMDPEQKFPSTIPYDQRDPALQQLDLSERRLQRERAAIMRELEARGASVSSMYEMPPPSPTGVGAKRSGPRVAPQPRRGEGPSGFGRAAGWALDNLPWLLPLGHEVAPGAIPKGPPGPTSTQRGGPAIPDQAEPGSSPSGGGGVQDLGGPRVAETEAPARLKEMSWSDDERTRPVELPPAESWGQLDPEHGAFFAILDDLKAQGFNIESVSVQQWAARRAKEVANQGAR